MAILNFFKKKESCECCKIKFETNLVSQNFGDNEEFFPVNVSLYKKDGRLFFTGKLNKIETQYELSESNYIFDNRVTHKADNMYISINEEDKCKLVEQHRINTERTNPETVETDASRFYPPVVNATIDIDNNNVDAHAYPVAVAFGGKNKKRKHKKITKKKRKNKSIKYFRRSKRR